ncbi:deacylase [Halovibrio salipaludis]|uniref:Deacylase n=1 Tax=Halovibrio salipaludis TaxID=2032626 RepID=A0A2A2F8F4_9GAMM|nr:YbaK/EbsC family protein [Halovibrio salipaludis]PAU81811.1 deacylase [Halovibrio salipaludis]
MPVQTLIEHLKAHGAEYRCLSHPPGFTAQSLAHHCNVPGDQVAKTVIIELDGRMAMLVMPASFRIRWDRMMEVLNTDFVELADEADFTDRFPDCEVGAMPPFGNLFGMTAYCSETLAEQPEITFAAGSHTEAMQIATRDYLALAQPVVISQGFLRPGARRPAWLAGRPGRPRKAG